MAAPLSAAATAALRAEFSVRQGRFSLSTSLIVDKLVTYLAARGEGINDLPFDIDRDDEEAWEKEWRQLATSAAVADALDIDHRPFRRCVRVSSTTRPEGGSTSPSSVTGYRTTFRRYDVYLVLTRDQWLPSGTIHALSWW